MQEIYVPALGMASDGVYLADWLKQPGDRVEPGEIVANIETDKAELDIEATAGGILGRHRYESGSDVPSGATIAVILGDGEVEGDGDTAPGADVPDAEASPSSASEQLPTPAAGERSPAAREPIVEASASASASASAGPLASGERRRDARGELEPYLLSPRARQEARAAGRAAVREEPAVEAVQTVAPVPASTAPSPDLGVAERGRPDRHRAAVAAAVSRSWAEIPHFAVQRELRVESLQRVHRALRALRSDVTLTDVLLKAYALALVDRFDSRDIHLGLAVATDRGVSIPVLRDVARSDVLTIAAHRQEAVRRAIDGRLSEDDALIPHSTLSNLGAYGVDSFTAIVPIGQTSILSVGAAAARPVIDDGALAVGVTMIATLNVDHRAWDGQHAAEALRRLAAIIAEPLLLGSLAE